MSSVHVALQEEIALEGLDGITLDALWFRLSERLKLPLPLYKNFQKEIWKLVLARQCFDYFLIATDRATPKTMDRREYFFNEEISEEEMKRHMDSTYYIYSYSPVDDPEIRGSCEEFHTRQKLDVNEIKELSLDQLHERYNQRFVIVASQGLRESVLIPRNIGREVDINNHAYCILERIGRSRYFGEATSGAFSLNDFVKDSKLLHYFRTTLLQNLLVVRQQIQLQIRGQKISGQLFHLPRFFVLVRATSVQMTETLFNFLKNKPNNMAETEEIRKFLNMKPKALAGLTKQRKNIFKLELKVPYRQCYPNATKQEYLMKTNNEKKINVVTLTDPKMDVSQLWHEEDDAAQGEENGFLDISNQLLNRPLLHQVYRKIEETGTEGMSQLEIGAEFGLPKLNARSVLRKMQRQRDLKFYMKDEGRQRVSKYVTRNASSHANENLIAEMTKLLMKADEAATQMPAPITPSPTKVSIPLSSSTMKLLIPEPEEKKSVVQLMMPQKSEGSKTKQVTSTESHQVISVYVPMEESSFIDNVEDVSVRMQFLNCIPKMKKESTGIAEAIAQNRISQKVLTRMNMILDLLKTRTVIDGVTLLSEMRQAEADLPEIICRKSMLSLCGKLHADNFLKVVELELKSEKKSVKSIFLVEPNVSFDMRCWHSIIEELKIQHFITNKRVQETRESIATNSPATVPKVPTEDDDQSTQSNDDFPKFMKLKLFHEFLYYLIYAYPGDHRKIHITTAVEAWAKENPKILDYEEITEKITNCYSSEISWKMFVPPLNPQRDYGDGWGLIRDIIHRIPLILFVKFTRAAQGSKELQKFLNHPIKSNYLLHFLPTQLRVDLLQGRKHVFVIQELCKRLCWCGLLQFGPSRTKEIDQTFIYLNRKASLLDTRLSDEGYLEISEMDYPELKFHFETPEDVAEYWNQMFQISINTRINKRSTAIGKSVEVDPSSSKPALQLALKVQSPESAPLNDLGLTPGDHKGAAGLDKSLMAHLKRNWSRQLNSKLKKDRSKTSLSSKLTVPSFKAVKTKLKKDKSSVVKEAATRIRNKSLKAKSITTLGKKSKVIKKKLASNLVRKREMEVEDAVDKAALKMMKTMRVTWTELEDKTLILTKVATKFAFPIDAQSCYYVSQNIVRDILHWRTDQALNKTTKACARRLQYLIKTKSTVKEQIALYVEELKANREFNTKYRNLVERLKKIYPPDEIYNVIKVHIVEIVHRLHQIFFKQYLGKQMDSYEGVVFRLPNNYAELTENFTITNPADSLIEKRYVEPETIKDAEITMLMNLVHGDVCCHHDRRKQQVEVYMKFPDAVLSTAIAQLKRTNVISVNKKDRTKDKSYLPSSFPQFHLSTRYASQIINVHVPFELYEEYYQAIQTLSSNDWPYQMKNVNCGWIFMLAEMLCSKKIALTHERAEKLVMVDPALRKKSTFDKITDNYLKLMSQESSSGLKVKKTVKLGNEDSDETFTFTDDPIEVFFKVRNIYLHIFCVLSALSKGEDIHMKSFKMSEDGDCSLKSCVAKEDEDFSNKIRQIACSEIKTVNEILDNQSSSTMSLSSVTTQNFLMFYEEAIQRNSNESDSYNRKDFSSRVMLVWSKMTVRKVLEMIVRLGAEPGLEEDSWLSEYKKISRKNDEDGMEDEEMESIKHSKMFSQLKDLNLNHRTSDSFVVNLSTIFVSLDQGAASHSIIPFGKIECSQILKHISDEARYEKEDIAKDDLIKELATVGITGPLEIMQLSEICSFVQSKSHMGAKARDLIEMFDDEHRLQKQMETLIKLKFVFRVGVLEAKFVHKEFVSFWLVESYFTTEIEAGPRGEEAVEHSKTDDEPSEEPSSKRIKLNDEAQSSSTTVENPEQGSQIVSPPRTTIRFRPSPWIRVDGLLNRQVLDKWLGTILNHLSINPSMMLTDLCNKFSVLSPFHIRELCDILQMIGCVELMTIAEPENDLFSDYMHSTTEKATMFCRSENIFVEINDDAMQRLSFFIDHKDYDIQFIST